MAAVVLKSIRWKLLAVMAGLLLVFSITLTIVYLLNAKAIDDNVDADTNSIHEQAQRQIRQSIYTTSLFLIAGAMVILFVSRQLIRPISRLTATAEDFARGDFSAIDRIQPRSDDEVGKLSQSFIKMAEHIRDSQAALRKTLDETRKTEEKLRLFFDHSMDLLGIAGFDAQFIEVNKAFEKTLGYDRAEICGRPFLTFVHPDDLQSTIDAVRRLSEGHNVIEFENRYACRDGTYRRLMWNAVAHRELELIYAVARDITAQRKLEEEIVIAGEQAQERIAHDLHDGLGQILTGQAYKAKLIEGMLKDGTIPSPRQAEEVVNLANQASAQARSLAHGLDPVELQHGLPLALEYLAHNIREVFGLTCTTEHDPASESIEKFMGNHLYRIAQEAVNNAIKHSKPRQVSIYLTCDQETINLVVMDDGTGMADNPDLTKGRGLQFMGYRAKLIGGTLALFPSPSGGQIVKCTVRRSRQAGISS